MAISALKNGTICRLDTQNERDLPLERLNLFNL